MKESQESFNARNYTEKQVAETFIINEEYRNLWRNRNTLVLGPRGSGKTTLFKMLTVPAIYIWDDPFATELQQDRPFTAIYVPTDMHWHYQLENIETKLINTNNIGTFISKAAVTTSILIHVVKTFKDRLHYETDSDVKKESDLSNFLREQFYLSKSISSLDQIIILLKSRVANIRQIINRIEREREKFNPSELPDYFDLDYFTLTNTACTYFDNMFKLKQSKKWALCLDELEIAPQWLQQLALSHFRSVDENFLIKLSTSPLPSISGLMDASPRHDLDLITIWNHSENNQDDFSEKLAQSILKRKGINSTPSKLFGNSDLIIKAEESKINKYDRDSEEWKLFKESAEWDIGFKNMLLEKDIDPDDPYTEKNSLKDSVLRKAKPIVALRNAFLKKSNTGEVVLRSRKLITIYNGKEAIYRIGDGNPRRLIGIIDDLCSKIIFDSNNEPQLSPSEQAGVLSRASDHFVGYISSLPGSNTKLGKSSLDLITILRDIGTFFRRGLLGTTFQLDPMGSFVVDSSIKEEITELLRIGVYHGAIVHVNPIQDKIETSLLGKRFRLSFMLSPSYKLPLRLYKEINLKNILSSGMKIRAKNIPQKYFIQEELPLKQEGEV
jgi:hypothetical protein